jgi:hypothetical protein
MPRPTPTRDDLRPGAYITIGRAYAGGGSFRADEWTGSTLVILRAMEDGNDYYMARVGDVECHEAMPGNKHGWAVIMHQSRLMGGGAELAHSPETKGGTSSP